MMQEDERAAAYNAARMLGESHEDAEKVAQGVRHDSNLCVAQSEDGKRLIFIGHGKALEELGAELVRVARMHGDRAGGKEFTCSASPCGKIILFVGPDEMPIVRLVAEAVARSGS